MILCSELHHQLNSCCGATQQRLLVNDSWLRPPEAELKPSHRLKFICWLIRVYPVLHVTAFPAPLILSGFENGETISLSRVSCEFSRKTSVLPLVWPQLWRCWKSGNTWRPPYLLPGAEDSNSICPRFSFFMLKKAVSRDAKMFSAQPQIKKPESVINNIKVILKTTSWCFFSHLRVQRDTRFSIGKNSSRHQ